VGLEVGLGVGSSDGAVGSGGGDVVGACVTLCEGVEYEEGLGVGLEVGLGVGSSDRTVSSDVGDGVGVCVTLCEGVEYE